MNQCNCTLRINKYLRRRKLGIRQTLKQSLNRILDHLQPAQQRRNLAHHLDSLNPSDRCLIVGNTPSLEKYSSLFRSRKGAIEVVNLDKQKLPPTDDVDLVVVVGQDNRQTHEFYAACNPYKARGIPVVFGTDERGLFYSAPTWKNANFSIVGMYYLAGNYLGGLVSKGEYCEFGVFDGRSFSLACHALRNVCTKFNAFDSFEGISGALENEEAAFVDGAYYANLETFTHNLHVAGVSDLPIESFKGNFQDTLTTTTAAERGIGDISIVHIDSDIYEAAILALEFVTPNLLDGALLLFDEFHAFGASNQKGERRALLEWLENHTNISVEPYITYTAKSKSFLVHIE